MPCVYWFDNLDECCAVADMFKKDRKSGMASGRALARLDFEALRSLVRAFDPDLVRQGLLTMSSWMEGHCMNLFGVWRP